MTASQSEASGFCGRRRIKPDLGNGGAVVHRIGAVIQLRVDVALDRVTHWHVGLVGEKSMRSRTVWVLGGDAAANRSQAVSGGSS